MSTNHWHYFAEFCRWSLASGGPAQNIDIVRKMASKIWDPQERAWRAMCYGAVYNVPYAEVIWREWPFRKAVEAEPVAIRAWCDDVMGAKRITTRVERRCVRRADWMTEYLLGARNFVADRLPALEQECRGLSETAAYELAWATVLSLPRVGRYMTLRLLELFRREGVLRITAPDIRPRDAWSPRRTLAMLLPDFGIPEEGNSDTTIEIVNNAVAETVRRLGDSGVEQTLFQLQVHLCEYRQAILGRRQYPGRPLDSELGYAHRAEAEWPLHGVSDIWWARLALFPSEHLGEVGGWAGPRKDVAATMADHGYVWSDLLWDYKLSRKDLANPVRRGGNAA